MQLTRQMLHAWVWSTPVEKVGEVLGVSGAWVAQVCKRCRVPTPPRGYWRRVSVGQTVPPTPLPDPTDISSTRINLPDEIAVSLLAKMQAQEEVSQEDFSPSHSEDKPSALEVESLESVGSQPPLVHDSMIRRAELHPTTAGTSVAEVSSAVGTSAESLSQLAIEYGRHLALQQLFDKLHETAASLDAGTAAILVVWLQSARTVLPQLDPAHKIVEACRHIATGNSRPEWWIEAIASGRTPSQG